ncbi:MAG: hypothetical protein ACLT31_05885 [Lachnospiraceae bacterium]
MRKMSEMPYHSAYIRSAVSLRHLIAVNDGARAVYNHLSPAGTNATGWAKLQMSCLRERIGYLILFPYGEPVKCAAFPVGRS